MAYTKQDFEDGQVLTAEHLNNMEQGIEDAGTQPDWNQTDETAADFIKNKPFGDTPTGGDTLIWDCDTTGLVEADLTDVIGFKVYKVSDAVPPAVSAVILSVAANGIEETFSLSLLGEIGGLCLYDSEPVVVLVASQDNLTIADGDVSFTIPEKGVYLTGPAFFEEFGVSVEYMKLTIHGYTGFPSAKKIDGKYVETMAAFYTNNDASDGYLYSDASCSLKATKADIEGAYREKPIVIFAVQGGLVGACAVVLEVTCAPTTNYAGVRIYAGVFYTAEYTAS